MENQQKTIAKMPILRQQISSRGGGVEVSLSPLGKSFRDHKMTAYQNYLGGGLLGSVQNDCTLPGWRDDERLQKIALQLRKYLHDAIPAFIKRAKGYPVTYKGVKVGTTKDTRETIFKNIVKLKTK